MTLDNSVILPFDKKFSRYNETHSPGLAVMVIEDGVTKFKKGYGLSNLETKDKIDCDTKFRMASVSKQFTAMAVAILEERRKIARNDHISQYLPDVPEYVKKIKVRHLVHHLSGLPDYADALWSSDKNKPLISNHDVYDYYKNRTNWILRPAKDMRIVTKVTACSLWWSKMQQINHSLNLVKRIYLFR